MKPPLWYTFLAALHQARGGCDRCHLFLAPGDPAASEVHGLPGTKVHSIFDLPEVLGTDPPAVWHDFGDTNAAHLVRMRASLGGRFPITYIVQPWHLLSDEMLTGPARLGPSDVLVCHGQLLAGALRALWQPLDRPAEERQTHPEIVIIPPGVRPSPVSAAEKADARHLLGLPAGQIIVLAFGELSPGAGMDVLPLLRAFAAAADRYADVLYVLAGADPEGLAGKMSDIGSAYSRT